MSKSIILTNEQIKHKIKRIAYQIYENNVTEKEIIIAGIVDNGYIFAEKLKKELKKICKIKIQLCQVTVNKKQPIKNNIKTSLKPEQYTDLSLVLVDDVLNSGATLIYAVKHFLDTPLKQFKTAVLVNRDHKKYPIKADFKGISLSTSIQEHITVVFTKKDAIAYLN
ncbi:MAG: phosphoribosyltransferase [Flavobacteriaceae bacterium]|nr:phosphoribosyltransferase [Flavobacteriaceae bacterium]